MSTKPYLAGFTSFLLGGVAGALIALFNAPQSGVKTRQLIRDKGVELKDKTIQQYEDARSQATKFVENLKVGAQTRTAGLMQAGREFVNQEKEFIEQNNQKG